MLVTLTDAPFDDPGWVFETKWGRLPACRQRREGQRHASLVPRLVVNDNYKSIAKALEKVRHDCAIDGELVAFDAPLSSMM